MLQMFMARKINRITNEKGNIKRNKNTSMLNTQAISLQEDTVILKDMFT